MNFLTFTEFETDNPIHLAADKIVAVKYADHATQVLCSDRLTFFLKDPPGAGTEAAGSVDLQDVNP